MGDTATNQEIHGRLQELVGPSRGGGTKELADGIGMPIGTVDRYVKGDRNPPHDFLLKVADWYEVSLDWLYGRSESGGAEQVEQKAPAWARRMDARLRFIERRIEELSAAPRLEIPDEMLSEVLRIAEHRQGSGAVGGTGASSDTESVDPTHAGSVG